MFKANHTYPREGLRVPPSENPCLKLSDSFLSVTPDSSLVFVKVHYTYNICLIFTMYRSSGGAYLAVPKPRLESKGERALSIRNPRLWNDLPEGIRLAESVTSFKSLLKKTIF